MAMRQRKPRGACVRACALFGDRKCKKLSGGLRGGGVMSPPLVVWGAERVSFPVMGLNEMYAVFACGNK